jgi:hypothetical protein
MTMTCPPGREHDYRLARPHLVATGPHDTVSVPRIARADVGPPVSFTVRLRPGQRAADITAVAPRLASTLGAAGLKVTNREAGWVTIVVVDPEGECGYGDGDGGVRVGNPGTRPRLPELRAA